MVKENTVCRTFMMKGLEATTAISNDQSRSFENDEDNVAKGMEPVKK